MGDEAVQTAAADLYRSGLTERAIAVQLGVSRSQVSGLLAAAGVRRRSGSKDCPVSIEELQQLAEAGVTQVELARRHGVSAGTARRWLAEAGIGEPDPDIDTSTLAELYLERRYTVRELGRHFGVGHHRIIYQLALAGIERRSRHNRRPRGTRAALDDETLTAAYTDQRLTISAICSQWGVSDEWVRSQLRRLGLSKRPGTWAANNDRDETLAVAAAELYHDDGLTIAEVAIQLEISATRTATLLHEHGVPVRPPGPRADHHEPREVLADLYADADIHNIITRHRVPVRDPNSWSSLDPFDDPIDLTEGLIRDLYIDIGLTVFQIRLLTGLGTGEIRARMAKHGIAPRSTGLRAPWTRRTYESRQPGV